MCRGGEREHLLPVPLLLQHQHRQQICRLVRAEVSKHEHGELVCVCVCVHVAHRKYSDKPKAELVHYSPGFLFNLEESI